jgi:hypothetical protein
MLPPGTSHALVPGGHNAEATQSNNVEVDDRDRIRFAARANTGLEHIELIDGARRMPGIRITR